MISFSREDSVNRERVKGDRFCCQKRKGKCRRRFLRMQLACLAAASTASYSGNSICSAIHMKVTWVFIEVRWMLWINGFLEEVSRRIWRVESKQSRPSLSRLVNSPLMRRLT